MKKKRQQYYWGIVKGRRNLDRERLSITLFSCLELKYQLLARHYDDLEPDDDDLDSWESVVEEEEERRQWDALPDTALLNIFCNTELKDRLQSIPLVCKSWKYVTDDPRCWSSMIPDSVSPEDAFIKNTSGYVFESYPPKSCIMKLIKKKKNYGPLIGISRLFKEEEEGDDQVEEEEEEEIYYEEIYYVEKVFVGLTRLRTLIKKSGGGAAITTLYLQPFYHRFNNDATNDEILRLIASSCPNLKHISFDLNRHTTAEAVLRLFNRCKKLELIEFRLDGSGFYHRRGGIFDDEQAILPELLSCLPNLRGFRIHFGYQPYPTAVAIATHLPQLKLLSIVTVSLTSKDLSIILVSCPELQYLYVNELGRHMLENCHDILDQASSQIPEFYYKSYEYPVRRPGYTFPAYSLEGYNDNWTEDTEDELNYGFEDDDYFCIDYYDDILQQRKEKKEHHYILKI